MLYHIDRSIFRPKSPKDHYKLITFFFEWSGLMMISGTERKRERSKPSLYKHINELREMKLEWKICSP